MSQIMKIALTCMFLLGGLSLMAGCGSSTSKSQASGSAESGHVAGWLPEGHKAAAKNDKAACVECHGGSYEGGISGVACAQCHLGDEDSVHPHDWSGQILIKHGVYVGGSGSAGHGNTACANVYCHGADLKGVSESGPSCTSCHMDGVSSAHPSAWATPLASHRDSVLLSPGTLNSCSNAACHGVNFSGISNSGPSCTSCHAEPYHNCTWCHGQPPATGEHSLHMNLTGFSCVKCHQVSSALHNNAAVNLESGITYSFTTKACAPACHVSRTWN